MAQTGKQLISFLSEATRQGRVQPAYKTSTLRVLRNVHGDQWGDVDIAALDVEQTIARFKDTPHGLSDGSFESYKSRFRRSVGLFLGTGRGPATGVETPSVRMIDYPLVLRHDPALVVVALHLPADLTRSEAERIADHLRQLTTEVSTSGG